MIKHEISTLSEVQFVWVKLELEGAQDASQIAVRFKCIALKSSVFSRSSNRDSRAIPQPRRPQPLLSQ